MIIKAIKKQIKLGRSGKPYASVLVQFDEYADGKGNRKWISGFGNLRTWAWKVGDDVAPEIEQKGNYLNFSFADTDENKLDVYRLPATIGFVMEMLAQKPATASKEGVDDTRPQETAGGSQVDDDEINPEDIPF